MTVKMERMLPRIYDYQQGVEDALKESINFARKMTKLYSYVEKLGSMIYSPMLLTTISIT